VGVSTADDFPESVLSLPRVSALPVNFEAVAALNPDVVFAAVQVNDVRDRSVFAELDIPVFYLPSRTLDDVLTSVLTVGDILHTGTVARDSVSALRIRANALSERVRGLPRPRVLFLISIEQLHSFGPESYVQDLITMAGGQSITADLSVEVPILDDEFVLAEQPDIIAGTFGRPFGRDEILALHPAWVTLPAIRNNRICTVDGDLVLRAGPRIVLGAEELFRCFHPNADR
jgi:ABC-type Fe3+-hydroxamate transport system substrate-binding protein